MYEYFVLHKLEFFSTTCKVGFPLIRQIYKNNVQPIYCGMKRQFLFAFDSISIKQSYFLNSRILIVNCEIVLCATNYILGFASFRLFQVCVYMPQLTLLK